MALTGFEHTKTRNVKDGTTGTVCIFWQEFPASEIFHFQYAPQVITTNIVKQRGERFNTGRCIFLPKMCNSYEVDLS